MNLTPKLFEQALEHASDAVIITDADLDAPGPEDPVRQSCF